MSWEGYIQAICAEGHLTLVDPYDSFFEQPKCYCGAGIAWENTVDQTNDTGFPFPVELLVVEQAQECKCPTCGHTHQTSVAKYRPPTKEELKEYETSVNAYYESLRRAHMWEE